MVSSSSSEQHGLPKPVPKSDWDRPPWNRWSFQHVREILPTVEVWRGPGPVRHLPRDEQQLDGLTVVGIDGEGATLAVFLDQTYTDGFLVLKGGAIAYERYFNGMDERSLHLSQSVSKSFAGALAGILAGRGIIDVNAQVTDVVPEFQSTAYRGATIQHVLDMASGVRFSEDYTDPLSDMGRADVASGWKPVPRDADPSVRWPQTMFDLILGLGVRERDHGGRFSYRSIETDVLAFVLERATGKRFAQLLSEELWQKIGMEESANMTVDAAGFALADGGLSACLRDYGRFGQMILEEWRRDRAGELDRVDPLGRPWAVRRALHRGPARGCLPQPVLDRGHAEPQPYGARRVRPARPHQLGASDGDRKALELARLR